MKPVRINERIACYKVVLIMSDGQKMGEMLKSGALDLARKQGLDLVEVSPGPIPTCKIMDYGKMQYERSKKDRGKQHSPTNKEIRFSYKIDQHDLEIKKKKIAGFLEDGHKVLVAMQIKGRERYVGQGTAREKYIGIVKEFCPTLKSSDIQESKDGYSYLVHPHNS